MVTETRPSDAGANGHGPDAGTEDPAPRPPDDWQPLWQNIDELREYVAYYFAVQADRLRLRIRKSIVATVAAFVAGIVGVTFIVTAVVLLLSGVGAGLGEALGGRAWLGNLIVGAAVLAAVTICLAVIGYGVVRASRDKTLEKYDSRRATQRRRFGQDVGGRN